MQTNQSVSYDEYIDSGFVHFTVAKHNFYTGKLVQCHCHTTLGNLLQWVVELSLATINQYYSDIRCITLSLNMSHKQMHQLHNTYEKRLQSDR